MRLHRVSIGNQHYSSTDITTTCTRVHEEAFMTYHALEVAVDAGAVNGDTAVGTLHQGGSALNLNIGQGWDQDLVLPAWRE